MANRKTHLIIRTDKDTHFTGAIAQNAGEEENIVLAGLQGGAYDKRVNIYIREIRVWSDENLAWEVQFYKSDDFANTDLDLDDWLGSYEFAAAGGKQVAGAGAFYYGQTKLELFYYDADGTGELHIKLVNRSTASKTAGAAGEVVVEIAVEKVS